jgi:hypothetical protein
LSVRGAAAVSLIAQLIIGGGVALAAPPDDHVLPVDQYTSEKGRQLANTWAPALRELDASIYHCLPWVEVHKQSIGFFRPKGASRDDRYLSLRIFIEQDPSPQFAALSLEERAASMFSRYVGPLLRRMTRRSDLLTDPSVDGFTVILEWLKQTPRAAAGGRPVHETIAIFLDKTAVVEYLSGAAQTRDLAVRARVLGFDGETPLGALRLAAWDDDFVATYKVKNYQLAPGVTCP